MSDELSSIRLKRCCQAHDDWHILTEHLLAEFGDVSTHDVLREVARGRRAVAEVSLAPPEDLFIAELIARNQLLMLTGELPDAARLDPQSHQRRREGDDGERPRV